MRSYGLHSPGLGYGQVTGPCEQGNAPSVSTKFQEFLAQQLIKFYIFNFVQCDLIVKN